MQLPTGASRFVFKDADGDVARLRLTGPGVMRLWSDVRRNVPPVIFLTGTTAQSTLSGTVLRRKNGDGVVRIHEISGTTSANVPVLTDPAFHVDVVNP